MRLSERDAFRILFREFFAQLFISESSGSDHQVKVAMIGVLTFLIMPGFFIPVQLIDRFELAAVHFPILVSPLTRLMATVFVTFAIVGQWSRRRNSGTMRDGPPCSTLAPSSIARTPRVDYCLSATPRRARRARARPCCTTP